VKCKENIHTPAKRNQINIVGCNSEHSVLIRRWYKQNKGKYLYDKENSCQKGKLPEIKIFKKEICWCDIMT